MQRLLQLQVIVVVLYHTPAAAICWSRKRSKRIYVTSCDELVQARMVASIAGGIATLPRFLRLATGSMSI